MRVDEVKAVIKAAEGKRNAVRWIVALALGLRQGEALGLRWDDVDFDSGVIQVRQALKRVKGKGLLFGSTKSKKSRRDILVPAEMLPMLKAHKKAQREEQMKAGSTWAGLDLVFCNEDGSPIDPSRDHRAWKALLVEAGVKPYRLHDARHSAATILMLRGVQPRVVQDILGHSQISVTMRYQHAVDELKKDAAAQMGAAIWG
jgi:integrase